MVCINMPPDYSTYNLLLEYFPYPENILLSKKQLKDQLRLVLVASIVHNIQITLLNNPLYDFFFLFLSNENFIFWIIFVFVTGLP